MAAETKVHIHDYRADKHTGRIELHLKCHTVDGNCEWFGPVRQYTADPQMLRDRFNDDINQFEAWAAREHRKFVGVHPDVEKMLMERKGKVIA